MNRLLLILLLVARSAISLNAQTNAPVDGGREILIDSDEWQFDLKSKVAIYQGNVRLKTEGMHLTCEVLTATLSATNSRIESFVGEENVVVDLVDDKGQKIHGTGNRLVYTYSVTGMATNEIVELTGNPVLDTAQGLLKGERITYDLLNYKLRAEPATMLLRPETTSKTNKVETTNAPAPSAQPPSP